MKATDYWDYSERDDLHSGGVKLITDRYEFNLQ
jgi:hypothetical protein